MVQVPDIVRLENEDHRPVYARDHRVESERCRPVVVLSPDCMTSLMVAAVGRASEGVVCTRNNNGEPRHDSEDFVGNKVGIRELFSLSKGIV